MMKTKHIRVAGPDEADAKFKMTDAQVALMKKWRLGIWTYSTPNQGLRIFSEKFTVACRTCDIYPLDFQGTKYFYNEVSVVEYDHFGMKTYLFNSIKNLPNDDVEVFSANEAGYSRTLIKELHDEYMVFEACSQRKEILYADGTFEEYSLNGELIQRLKKIGGESGLIFKFGGNDEICSSGG